MIVELRATRYDRSAEGIVVWCNEDAAEQFSVYVGEPGNFKWAADFAEYETALSWAHKQALTNRYVLRDLVAEERERKTEEPVAT